MSNEISTDLHSIDYILLKSANLVKNRTIKRNPQCQIHKFIPVKICK